MQGDITSRIKRLRRGSSPEVSGPRKYCRIRMGHWPVAERISGTICP